MSDFLVTLENQPFYGIIERAYRGKIARRSGVPYINHIREGATILHRVFAADDITIEAFCLHPLFQNNRALQELGDQTLSQITPRAILLAMEYRRVANLYTLTNPVKSSQEIEIGTLSRVHQMLAADKIQNKKDFLLYMFDANQRPSYRRTCERTLCYFNSWLERLGVDEAMYQRAVECL